MRRPIIVQLNRVQTYALICLPSMVWLNFPKWMVDDHCNCIENNRDKSMVRIHIRHRNCGADNIGSVPTWIGFQKVLMGLWCRAVSGLQVIWECEVGLAML